MAFHRCNDVHLSHEDLGRPFVRCNELGSDGVFATFCDASQATTVFWIPFPCCSFRLLYRFRAWLSGSSAIELVTSSHVKLVYNEQTKSDGKDSKRNTASQDYFGSICGNRTP